VKTGNDGGGGDDDDDDDDNDSRVDIFMSSCE